MGPCRVVGRVSKNKNSLLENNHIQKEREGGELAKASKETMT